MTYVRQYLHLRDANIARLAKWHKDTAEWSGADWSNAMCGEVGEAANIVKKLRRDETGVGVSYHLQPAEDLRQQLADELADVVIYADLVAHHYNISLRLAVAEKFNRVSALSGFPERLVHHNVGL